MCQITEASTFSACHPTESGNPTSFFLTSPFFHLLFFAFRFHSVSHWFYEKKPRMVYRDVSNSCAFMFSSICIDPGTFFLSKQREKQRERDLIQTLTKSFILSFSFLLFILYSADGNYEVRYKCNVLIYASGEVLWVPPAIYQVRNIDSFELYYSKYDISYAVFDIDNSFLFIYTT